MFQVPVLIGLAVGHPQPRAGQARGRRGERRRQMCSLRGPEGWITGRPQPETKSTSRGRVFGAWADHRHLRARDYANSSEDGRVGVFKGKVVTKPPLGNNSR